jgi:hypothetical protein
LVPFAHALFGLLLALLSWRALEQPWLADQTRDPWAAAAIRAGIPLVTLAGSALSIWAGRLGGDARRALRQDAASGALLFVTIFVLALGGIPRDTVGLVFVLTVATRLGPAAYHAVRHGAPPVFVFALAFAAYAPLAGWRVAASLPLGDQVFYLLSAERLARGSLDATIDPRRFFELVGLVPQALDAATHVVNAPAGARTVQGYVMPALLAPGWILGGEVGATLVIALVAAFVAAQTWLLLGETVDDARAVRVAWALMAFLAPLVLLATHVYPNAPGAALIVMGYRYAYTARTRRPALAGALVGATAFLNPRDGLALLVLAPFALRWSRDEKLRAALAAVALVLVAAIVSGLAYGIPLPFVGYLYGTGAAQDATSEPSWSVLRVHVALPAILFDRVFGIAGTAPWLFLGVLGLAPALRAARDRLLPAAALAGVSLIVLSLFRYWEGGYAPPNRYIVDVLPLIAPFVAYGLIASRTVPMRAVAAVLVGASALVTLFLLAVPSAALNSAYEDKPQQLLEAALGIDPLGWLPSFQPITPDWWIAAYLRLIPALLFVIALAWYGARRSRA